MKTAGKKERPRVTHFELYKTVHLLSTILFGGKRPKTAYLLDFRTVACQRNMDIMSMKFIHLVFKKRNPHNNWEFLLSVQLSKPVSGLCQNSENFFRCPASGAPRPMPCTSFPAHDALHKFSRTRCPAQVSGIPVSAQSPSPSS